MNDFDYLGKEDVYLDCACQSLRPRAVIDALNEYYTNHNACGERAKYKWGRLTDEKVDAVRQKVLKLLKLKPKEYNVSFTLNTTYGINLILNQLKSDCFDKVITSEIEHNSVFLSTLAFAEKNQIERVVIKRNSDGSVPIDEYDFKNALVVMNCVSNIDGRQLVNLKELIRKVHKDGGVIIVDAAQAMAHNHELLIKTEADVICFSAHKLYAPSLGVIVWREELREKVESSFIGGGMVDDVEQSTYRLSTSSGHKHTLFEPGLQAWGEIIGLGAAIDWLNGVSKKDQQRLERNAKELFEFLKSSPKVHLINEKASTAISFYVDGIDSHLLGEALSREGIMARTGYFCVHYYLDHVCHYPALIRLSLGYHNRTEDIEKVKQVLSKVLF